MARYPGAGGKAEGSLAKVLGALMLVAGIYSFLKIYGKIQFEIFSNEQLLIICAAAAIIGGIYMIASSRRKRLYQLK